MAQHGPARSYLVNDQYVLQQADGNPAVFVDDATISLQEFKNGHLMLLLINKYSMDPLSVKYLQGQKTEEWYSIATEIARKVCRSLIKKLGMLEADGRCVDNLQEVHIRLFPSGKVKLRGVDFLTREQLGDADYLTALRANHAVVAGLIRDLFYTRNCALMIPPDVNHLLDLMVTEAHFQHWMLFISHGSIVPFTSYPGLFKYYFDLVKVPAAAATYETVAHQVGQDANWRIGVKNNALLLETYNYGGGGSAYEFSQQENAALAAICRPTGGTVSTASTQWQEEVILSEEQASPPG